MQALERQQLPAPERDPSNLAKIAGVPANTTAHFERQFLDGEDAVLIYSERDG